MPMRNWMSLSPNSYFAIPVEEEEEEGGEYLFDPEAGRASDDPFAHLASKDAPDSAASEDTVSKYVAGEEE